MIKIGIGNVKEGGSTVPAGTYHCFVTDCELKYGQTSNEPYIKFEFRIDGGDYDGRKIFTNASLSEKALPITKSTLRALGYDVDQEELDFDPDSANGRECIVATKLEKYEGEDQTRVKKVHSMDSGVEITNGVGAVKSGGGTPSKSLTGKMASAGKAPSNGNTGDKAKKALSMFSKKGD